MADKEKVQTGYKVHQLKYSEGLNIPILPSIKPAREPAFILSEDIGRIDGYLLGKYIMEVVGDGNLKCVQPVRSIWRIYFHNEPSRIKFISEGLSLEGKKVKIYSSNPLATGSIKHITHGSDTSIQMVKLLIKDLPESASNDDVRHMLCTVYKVTLTTTIKMGFYRDPDSKLVTTLENGDRFVWVHPDQVIKPIPRNAQCGIFPCRIFYRGQFPPQECFNCYQTDHNKFNCPNKPACKVCKEPGHKPGSPSCAHYVPKLNIKPYGGYKDPLSNHYEHEFTFRETKGKSAEHHWMFQKAMIHNQPELARMCLGAKNAAICKRLGKGIRCVPDWDDSVMARELMKGIQWAKFQEVQEFQESIEDAHVQGLYLVEAVYKNGHSIWSTGLDIEATLHTDPVHWPGNNQMGQILNQLAISQYGPFWAKSLFSSRITGELMDDSSSWDNTEEQSIGLTKTKDNTNEAGESKDNSQEETTGDNDSIKSVSTVVSPVDDATSSAENVEPLTEQTESKPQPDRQSDDSVSTGSVVPDTVDLTQKAKVEAESDPKRITAQAIFSKLLPRGTRQSRSKSRSTTVRPPRASTCSPKLSVRTKRTVSSPTENVVKIAKKDVSESEDKHSNGSTNVS